MAKKRRIRPVRNPELIGAGKRETVNQILAKGGQTVQNRIEEIKVSKLKQMAQATQAPKPSPSKGRAPSAPSR